MNLIRGWLSTQYWPTIRSVEIRAVASCVVDSLNENVVP